MVMMSWFVFVLLVDLEHFPFSRCWICRTIIWANASFQAISLNSVSVGLGVGIESNEANFFIIYSRNPSCSLLRRQWLWILTDWDQELEEFADCKSINGINPSSSFNTHNSSILARTSWQWSARAASRDWRAQSPAWTAHSEQPLDGDSTRDCELGAVRQQVCVQDGREPVGPANYWAISVGYQPRAGVHQLWGLSNVSAVIIEPSPLWSSQLF
jgi:hypothetical protein